MTSPQRKTIARLRLPLLPKNPANHFAVKWIKIKEKLIFWVKFGRLCKPTYKPDESSRC